MLEIVFDKLQQSSNSLGLKSVVYSVPWCVEGEAKQKLLYISVHFCFKQLAI